MNVWPQDVIEHYSEPHRKAYVAAYERIVKAYRAPAEVREENAGLLERLVDEAEEHRCRYTQVVSRTRADELFGTIRGNAERRAEPWQLDQRLG